MIAYLCYQTPAWAGWPHAMISKLQTSKSFKHLHVLEKFMQWECWLFLLVAADWYCERIFVNLLNECECDIKELDKLTYQPSKFAGSQRGEMSEDFSSCLWLLCWGSAHDQSITSIFFFGIKQEMMSKLTLIIITRFVLKWNISLH